MRTGHCLSVRRYGYESGDEHYPVLYLLETAMRISTTPREHADYLAYSGRTPELIIVAIRNTDRNRDLTPPPSTQPSDIEDYPTHGGADNFLRFISDELSHHDTWGETASTELDRIQHSSVTRSEGSLPSHALVTRPDVFDAYIAISPGLQWDDQRLVTQADHCENVREHAGVDG